MRTITAILDADADGTLHLPLPAELRHGKIKVQAQLEVVPTPLAGEMNSLKGFGCLRGKIHMAPDFDAPLDEFKDYLE